MFDAYATEEHIDARLRWLADRYDGLRALLLDLDGQQDALERRRRDLPGQ
jgi:hypothetical protein